MGGNQSQPTGQAGRDYKYDPAKVDAVSQNIEAAIDLLKRYNNGNIQSFYKHISENAPFSNDLKSLDPVTREKLKKYIDSLGNIETNARFTQALQNYNLQTIFKEDQSANFKQQLEGLRRDIDPNLFKEAETFANQLAEITSREKYFKYYYLLTQLWLIVYIRRMSTAVVDFTTTTINLFNITEKKRNDSTTNLLKKLLLLLKTEQGDLSEADFNFFRTSMTAFEKEIAASTAQMRDGLVKAKAQLSKAADASFDSARPNSAPITGQRGMPQTMPGSARPGSAPPGPAPPGPGYSGGFVRDGSRFPESFYEEQSGGFVRDGSRFPEAFYAEPTKTFDQFGGQSFSELEGNKQ